MIIRAVGVTLLAWMAFANTTESVGLEKEVVTFGYLQRENDPAYVKHRSYTGLVLRDRSPPIDGARTALKESRVLGRSADVRFKLAERVLGEKDDVTDAMTAMMDEGTRYFLLDLPLADVKKAASDLSEEEVLLFNIRHGANELRGADCSPVLFHTIPSDAMLMDGLAQFLLKKNWTDILVLAGEGEPDLVMSEAFQGAARKFGLNITGVRPFILGNDPRVRDQTNVAILTGGVAYDVIFIADTLGEFGRYVPYHTQEPRPIVGSEGLVPSAWHWTWERYGAPQLNQRFNRIAKRRMTGTDYAAWAAVKSVVEAMIRVETRDYSKVREFLTSDAFTLDSYKGWAGNFRSWNNQLRQAVLLHTHNAVIARAPLEGFLHQINNLDTLGQDQRESPCRFQ